MNSCERRERITGVSYKRSPGVSRDVDRTSSAGNGWASALMGGEGGGFASRRTDRRHSEVQIEA